MAEGFYNWNHINYFIKNVIVIYLFIFLITNMSRQHTHPSFGSLGQGSRLQGVPT